MTRRSVHPTHRTARRTRALFPFVIALALSPSAGGAQTVRGRLLESGSGDPIMLGAVALLDTTLTVIDEVFTNEKGNFILQAPRPGSYYVLADRLGYQRSVDGILELGPGGDISVDFYLRPQPIVLDSLTVEAERQRRVRRLESAGFYQREKAGFGHFVTPEMIERRLPLTTRDLLRTVPALRVVDDGFLGQTIVMRGNRGQPCSPQLYVDGAKIASAGGGGVRLEDIVNIDDVSGVEIYDGGADTPLEYGGTQNGCGVLLVWTKGR
jgi:hypothetical protein